MNSCKRPVKAGWLHGGGFYAIADNTFLPDRSPSSIAADLLVAKPAVLQLRAKTFDAGRLCREAGQIARMCGRAGVPFVVNDRPDVALCVEADGVHLGQDDLPLRLARKLARRKLVIGISTHSVEQAVKAFEGGADYIGFGPVFETRTKENPLSPRGLRMLKNVRARVSIPIVAIGGITPENAAAVFDAGADFVAAISFTNRGDVRRRALALARAARDA